MVDEVIEAEVETAVETPQAEAPKPEKPVDPPESATGEDQWKTDLAAAYKKATDTKPESEPDDDDQAPALKDAKPPAAQPAKAKDAKPADDADKADDPEAKDEPESETADAAALKTFPASLPKEVKDHWAKIPERARELLASHERTLSAKVAEAGRKAKAADEMQAGLQPVRSALEDAIRDFPTLANERPEDVARKVTETAKTIELLNSNPVGVLLQEAQHRGVIDQLRAALAGEQPTDNGQHTQQLMRTIEDLQRQVQGLSDPGRFRQMLDERDREQQVEGFVSVVTDYAQTAEHWQLAEERLPRYIEILQMEQPQLAGRDLLDAAYKRAIAGLGLDSGPGDERATIKPLPQPTQIDAGSQAKAISVNAPRRTEGEQRPLEGQALYRQAYRQATKRHTI